MALKLKFCQHSWTETAAAVRTELLNNFPNLSAVLSISRGILCNLDDPKEAYRLGFVFLARDLRTKKRETFVYYPIKNAFAHYYGKLNVNPVRHETPPILTKRGKMTVVMLSENEYAVDFASGHILYEETVALSE